jgi:hypothetical protein
MAELTFIGVDSATGLDRMVAKFDTSKAPTNREEWITFLEWIMVNPFTIPAAKRWAVLYFGVKKRPLLNIPHAQIREAVSDALRYHPRVSSHRGSYKIAPLEVIP